MTPNPNSTDLQHHSKDAGQTNLGLCTADIVVSEESTIRPRDLAGSSPCNLIIAKPRLVLYDANDVEGALRCAHIQQRSSCLASVPDEYGNLDMM
jgi:hypothetical protein